MFIFSLYIFVYFFVWHIRKKKELTAFPFVCYGQQYFCMTYALLTVYMCFCVPKKSKTKQNIDFLTFLASFCQKMLLFDGQEGTFRTIKLRPRQPDCIVCGPRPVITELIDYQQFCGSQPDDKVLCHRLHRSKRWLSDTNVYKYQPQTKQSWFSPYCPVFFCKQRRN